MLSDRAQERFGLLAVLRPSDVAMECEELLRVAQAAGDAETAAALRLARPSPDRA